MGAIALAMLVGGVSWHASPCATGLHGHGNKKNKTYLLGMHWRRYAGTGVLVLVPAVDLTLGM